MEEEKQEAENFDIMKMFEEIATYKSIQKENILDFILEEAKGDTARLYYRHMLLQLLENDEHLVSIMNAYDRKKPDNTKSREVLEAFARGDTEELRKIIEFARDTAKLDDFPNEKFEINEKMEKWRISSVEELRKSKEIEESTKEQEELQARIEDIKKRIETEYKGIKGVIHFGKKSKLEEHKKNLEGRLAKLQAEYPSLLEQQTESVNQAKGTIEEMREIFCSIGLQRLGEKIIGNLPDESTTATNFFDIVYRRSSG